MSDSYRNLASSVGERTPKMAGHSNKWIYLSPLIFAPLIPLTRIALRNQSPKVMNRAMLGLIGVALVHGMLVLTKTFD